LELSEFADLSVKAKLEGYLRRQCAIRDDEDRNHQGVGENQKEEHKNKTLNSKH
jgi:hypothetical protein